MLPNIFGGDIIPDATTGVDHIPFLDRNYYYAIVALNDVGADHLNLWRR